MNRIPFLKIFAAVHAALFGAFLLSLAVSPHVGVSVSLFDILPPASALKSVQAADSVLADRTGRAVTVLAKSANFATARRAAELFYDEFVGTAFVDSLSLHVGDDSVAQAVEWLHEWRYQLLDGEMCARLEDGGAADVALESLASVYGAFPLVGASLIETDPFMLTDRALRALLSGGALASTAMSPMDGVLAAQSDGAWYVLVRGTLSRQGTALTNKKSAVRAMYRAGAEICARLRAESVDSADLPDSASPGVEFIFSGVPFHSYENSSSAQAQISVISAAGLLLVVALFLALFRSPVPALASAGAVALSCAAGLCATLLVFRTIHILTFVFGTTLIGTGLDYSIHFFVAWKHDGACRTGADVRARIVRGVSLGFLSTEICFAALLAAPFPLLRQVAVFLGAGLLSAFLCVAAVFPLIPLPARALSTCRGFVLNPRARRALFAVPLVLAAASAVVVAVRPQSLRVANDISSLCSVSDFMLKNESESRRVLDTGASGWYFLLRADSEEQLLQRCEQFGVRLEQARRDGKRLGWLSPAQFVRSRAAQERSARAAAALVPLAERQFAALGFAPDEAAERAAAFSADFDARRARSFGAGDLPAVLRDATENLWLGELGGAWYACVLPLHADDAAYFRSLADTSADGVFFVDKVHDISAQLDTLTRTMLRLLAAAFAAVCVMLCVCYPVRTAARIAAIPPLSALVAAAVLSVCGVPLGFFPVTALVLVFGLGLDYVIYAAESARRPHAAGVRPYTGTAIALSFATTALSFGALMFSSFAPVHVMGLTVTAGLTTAVAAAFTVPQDGTRGDA